MRKAITFSPPFVSTPTAWVRGSGTLGLSDTVDYQGATYDKDEEIYWARFVTLTAAGATIETDVYKILGVPSAYEWYPVPPPEVSVALTLVGVPSGGETPEMDADRSKPGEETTASAPLVFELKQVLPNPSWREPTIGFELPLRLPVRLEVFDAQGRLVRIIADGEFTAGSHTVDWDLRDQGGHRARPGVYLYRLVAGTYRDQKKLVVLSP